MFNRIFLTILPLTMLAVSAKANDDFNFDLTNINDAEVTLIDDALDIDIDAFSNDAGTENESDDQAIEACFRRIGYQGCGWGGYQGWGHCNPCYQTYRPYFCCHQVRYCAPIYRYVRPVYNCYWGCH